MPGLLDGKVVAITGASSGIGEATALALASEGASISLAARRTERIEALAGRIAGHGARAVALPTDITHEDSAHAFISETHGRLGALDVLVNNAGVMLLGPVEGADTEDWRRMVEVNLMGLLYCTHAALPIMRQLGGGHIVNISSTAGRTAGAGSAVYNLTKWGVCGFSEALRQEALRANVRVTIVEPGFVDTELQGHNQQPAVVEATRQTRATIGEVLQPRDIAGAVLFAISQPEHVAVNEMLVRPTRQER